MKDLLSKYTAVRTAIRAGAIYLMVAVFFSAVPISVSAAISTDIKANDSDGPVAVVNGNSFTYSWSSVEATACALTSPTGNSGISLAGSGGPIDPGHPWYPA